MRVNKKKKKNLTRLYYYKWYENVSSGKKNRIVFGICFENSENECPPFDKELFPIICRLFDIILIVIGRAKTMNYNEHKR